MKKGFLLLMLLLTLALIGGALSACAKKTAQTPADAADEAETPAEDAPGEFVPVLRFVAASDVHFTDAVTVRDEKFEKMFTNAYAYCDAHETYNKLDGVFVAGDVANDGSATSLTRFFEALTGNAREGTVTRAILGNHEFFTDPANTVNRFLAASGYESDDAHLVIGGYHFIFISPNQEGKGFSSKKQSWLAEQLSAAVADDPTGKKPIFVFQHQHVKNTVYGSADSWGIQDLYPVLSMCPQVVDFSGHSHFPINDPRSVWQGTFTAFNTATLKSFEMDLIGVADQKIYFTDDKGGWSTTDMGRADEGQYYIVEVDARNRILVQAFDVQTGQSIMTPIFIEQVGDPDAFTYTNARRDSETPPVFAKGAAVTPVRITDTGAVFRFPRTTGETYVQNYRCEVYQGDTSVSTVYRLDDGFLFPAPETLILPLGGLLPNTAYRVRIVPVTAWGNEGEPLCFTFTTKSENTMSTPADALVFSARFGHNDTAVDAVTDTALIAKGTPTTVYDETQGKYIGVFDGQSAYVCYDVDDCYAMLYEGFTFETYVRMDAAPASGYVNHFSNMESGGFGFEYKSDGRMMFYVHAGGSYQIAVIPQLATGTWAHLVATYNREALIFYVNGEEVVRLAATGPVKPPKVQFLAIGADSALGGGCSAYATCTVGCANVYSAPLTASQVAALYAAYTH